MTANLQPAINMCTPIGIEWNETERMEWKKRARQLSVKERERERMNMQECARQILIPIECKQSTHKFPTIRRDAYFSFRFL